MGQKLSAPDLALYRAVDEVLHYIWDPIGIRGMPQARDEYQGYVTQVFALLREGADKFAIAKLLTSIRSARMGLSSRPEHDSEVAGVLLEWKKRLRDHEV